MDDPLQTGEPQATDAGDLPEAAILSEPIYGSFEQMLTPAQISELYAMCLNDADRRIRLLQQSAAAQDQENFCTVIHAIKGTCGMVGALQLASLAAAMEQGPMPVPDDSAPYERFLCASAHLRRILNSKSIPPLAGI